MVSARRIRPRVPLRTASAGPRRRGGRRGSRQSGEGHCRAKNKPATGLWHSPCGPSMTRWPIRSTCQELKARSHESISVPRRARSWPARPRSTSCGKGRRSSRRCWSVSCSRTHSSRSSPLVCRSRLPRALAIAVVFALLSAGLATVGLLAQRQAAAFVDALPATIRGVQQSIERARREADPLERPGAVEQLRSAAAELKATHRRRVAAAGARRRACGPDRSAASACGPISPAPHSPSRRRRCACSRSRFSRRCSCSAARRSSGS